MIHAWPRLFTRFMGIWNPCSCNDMGWLVWRWVVELFSLMGRMGDLGVVVWMMNHFVLFLVNRLKQVMRNSLACFHPWYHIVISQFHFHLCNMIHSISIEESYGFRRKPNESCQLDPSMILPLKTTGMHYTPSRSNPLVFSRSGDAPQSSLTMSVRIRGVSHHFLHFTNKDRSYLLLASLHRTDGTDMVRYLEPRAYVIASSIGYSSICLALSTHF